MAERRGEGGKKREGKTETAEQEIVRYGRKRGLLSRGYFRFDAPVDAREESTTGGVRTP